MMEIAGLVAARVPEFISYERGGKREKITLISQDVKLFDSWTQADIVLRILDIKAAHEGASKACDPAVKCIARIIGPADACEQLRSEWKTQYIRDSSTADLSSQQHMLGVDLTRIQRQSTVWGSYAETRCHS